MLGETPVRTRRSTRLKLQNRSTSVQLPHLNLPPSGSSSWLEEGRTYHKTVTNQLHLFQQWPLEEGSSTKTIQNTLNTERKKKVIRQKLSFDCEQENFSNHETSSNRERRSFYIGSLFLYLQKRIELFNDALRSEKKLTVFWTEL